MKESSTIAMEYIKANATRLGLTDFPFDQYNIHIHVPEGATPKDGPSAGITMLTSLVSLFTQKRVKKHLSMTGEITFAREKSCLLGESKKKYWQPSVQKSKKLFLSESNRKDIAEIKEDYLKGLTFHFVKEMHEVLDLAITDQKVKHAKVL